ncbi:MAG: DUF5606 domain-containing protein [Flavobacteriales bacterium]|nr:DUF5606 domain-containing protein [Flavobacteriales bacterium]
MDLSGIISISGKPGLFKVLANNKSSLVVESLVDGKKTTALATQKVSALEDISIYTEEDDVPLREVYQSIYDKENGGVGPNHKGEMAELKNYLSSVLPDYDEDRVYNSDIKKLFQWYNILHEAGALKISSEEVEVDHDEAEQKEAE